MEDLWQKIEREKREKIALEQTQSARRRAVARLVAAGVAALAAVVAALLLGGM